ncbi:hypothetical protein EUX98_g6505 [Antrodiella citrinella]|uniref:AB hydrolase-1 domain-containing protein n=1 Tax=Antrodiella citrinella TaxID=2447956 RepID=A0A4S4MNT8_9APHY|nr:hypothetical protein EUX98_g6505 [Antrodiella citrinella]
MSSANPGSKRWTAFYTALQTAIQRSTHKWTYEDFTECFSLWCEEEPASSSTVFSTVAQHMESGITNRVDELLVQFNIKENLDKVQTVVSEAKARKKQQEPYEGHDLWREDLQPRAAVRARTIPLLEKERDRLKEMLIELDEGNLKLQAEMQANVRAREEADAEATALLDILEQLREKWDEVAVDDIEAWTLQTAESIATKEWTVTTHLVPAAYRRTTPLVPVPVIPSFAPGKDKEQRKAELDALARELDEMKNKQAKGELEQLGRDETLLWCCVNRYVRKRDGKGGAGQQGLTLFFAHANGFPKEIWEPTVLYLTNVMHEQNASYHISEVWMWEAVNHGDSALINAGKLSGMYDWQDNARDLSHFLLHYLPEVALGPLPIHLPRLSHTVTTPRERCGFPDRTVVAVGHSFGGCSLAWAASHEPYKRLFSSLILVDPIIADRKPTPTGEFLDYMDPHIVPALLRRDHWTSRAEALELFKSSPFFRRWDPAVLDIYIQCGIYDDPKGGVRLKMEPIHEAITFAEKLSSAEPWYHLCNIDERVRLKFIMPSGGGQPGGPEQIKEKQRLVWRRPVNSCNVINANAGHLIAQETPRQLAADIHIFLQENHATLKHRL